jgi:arsenate reductase (glutaredoxin)
MIRIYHYEKCSTCRQALAFVKKQGLTVEAVSIVEHPPTRAEVAAMKKRTGSLKSLFNTTGQEYRRLELKDKLATMSEKEAIDLLSQNGMLVKRPFLISPHLGLVGFKESEWKNALKATA